MKTMQSSRRTFLTRAVKTSVAIALWNTSKHSDAIASTPHDLTLDLTQTAYNTLNTVGKAVYATVPATNDKLIILRLSATEISAFSSKCTHQGCQVNLPSNGFAVCPCHSAKYDTSGKVVSGPATKDLTKYSAVLSGNFIYIDRFSVDVTHSQSNSSLHNGIEIQKKVNGITIHWKEQSSKPLTYTVYSTLGQQLVPETNISGNSFTIPRTFQHTGTIILKVVTSKSQELTFGIQPF